MTVSIIASAIAGGAAFSDVLAGSGIGAQFGTVEASQIPTTTNVHIRHDGANKITNLKFYLKAFSQAYGGEYSASADLVKVIEQGDLGSGFQVDLDWDGTAFAGIFTQISSALGSSMNNAVLVPTTAIYENVGGVATTPSGTPVAGELQPSTTPANGDCALLKCRWGVPLSETAPGRRQIDLAFLYNFTT